jgi:hypothetical protein
MCLQSPPSFKYGLNGYMLFIPEIIITQQGTCSSGDLLCMSPNTTPDWQPVNPLTTKCADNNTGHLLRLVKDVNPGSPTYNQTTWQDMGVSSACQVLPPPCSTSACIAASGEGYACVKGVCEYGAKVYTQGYFENGQFVCVYHYEYSDGSWSVNYFYYSSGGAMCIGQVQ